ncbi:MAG: L-aspartate oxidase [Cyclobacteriaceae bacterium]|nr:L-aspartate oxidase [Cyclobacteriaceae bacterium]
MEIDFLVIGSGIAGLTYALKTAQANPAAQVIVVTKSDENESNTKYAQGGIAVVLNKVEDSIEQHIQDTLRAGDGLCDEEVVRVVVEEGIERFHELLQWGANFDKSEAGEFILGREGGHTVNRVASHKDITGYEIERALLNTIHNTSNIKLLTHHFVIDLITDHHLQKRSVTLGEETTCYGAYVLDYKTGDIKNIAAKVTLLASGGVGNVYKNTTNPTIATGDGIGLAYRAKAWVKDMAFIQFHPSALYQDKEGQRFLISEAVRGAGALLKTKQGERFMLKYDERGELASRDIVARAIDTELKISGDDYVLLDCSGINETTFKTKFPNIYHHCVDLGIDIFKKGIPVVPAAHYLCGGIQTDLTGRTTLKNLLACGECAYTGLHGANRLASNSLLEALVFAHRCAETATAINQETGPIPSVPPWEDEGLTIPGEKVLITHFRKEVQSVMSDFVSIVRSDKRLQIASRSLEVLYSEINELYRISKLSLELGELRNLVSVAYAIVEQSKEQRENRGVFFNRDLETH